MTPDLPAAVGKALGEIADRQENPWKYIVVQTLLVTNAGRQMRVSTVRLTSAFLADMRDAEIYETMLFQSGKSFDAAWTGSRADAVAAHREKIDLLTLNMALVYGEHVTAREEWPLQLEAPTRGDTDEEKRR